jgi:transcriptional regulator with XRE-family HTH domain
VSNIGNFLRKIRTEHNLSLAKLAEKSGVADTTIMKWEKGESSPNIDKLQKVIGALGYKMQIVKTED